MQDQVQATILFADLMNATEMSKNLNLQEYDEMLMGFQGTAYEIVSHHLINFGYQGNGKDSEWSISGDELRVFLYSDSIRFDVRNALLLALKIKLAWLTSDFNQRIMREGRLVSRIGVGVNCGPVIKAARNWRIKMGHWQPCVEGYAINLTKRIESLSREGTVYQITVGDALYKQCQAAKGINVRFSKPFREAFKGVSQKIAVYEIVSFLNFEIISTMPLALQNGLVAKLEDTITKTAPEPWIYFVLLRHYISQIASGKDKGAIQRKALKYAEEVKDSLEYKVSIYNMLGWLYAYGKTVQNREMALNYFNRTLRLEQKNQQALLHKARIHELEGERDMARHVYQEILFHDKEHAEARQKVAKYALF